MRRTVRAWSLLRRWIDERDKRALPPWHVPLDAGRHKLGILSTDARGLLELNRLCSDHSVRGGHVPYDARRSDGGGVLGLPRRLRVPIALGTSGAVRLGRVQPGKRDELYGLPRRL